MVIEKNLYQNVNQLITVYSEKEPETFNILFCDWPRTQDVIKNLCNYIESLGLENTKVIENEFFTTVIKKAVDIYLKTVFTFDEESLLSFSQETNPYNGDAIYRLKVFITNLICYSISFMNSHGVFESVEIGSDSFRKIEKLLYNEITPENLKQVLRESEGYEKTLVYDNDYIFS